MRGEDGLLIDPIEADPKIKEIIDLAGEQASQECADYGISGLGACHAIWPCQQRILKEKYNIEWKTPTEMNPNIMFD